MQIRLNDLNRHELKEMAETVISLWARTGVEEPTTRKALGRLATAITDELERAVREEFSK